MSSKFANFGEIMYCGYNAIKYLGETSINGREVSITATVDTSTELKGASHVRYDLFIRIIPGCNNDWLVTAIDETNKAFIDKVCLNLDEAGLFFLGRLKSPSLHYKIM